MKKSEKKNLISIITVVKNAELTIEKCIQSVLSQNYSDIEYKSDMEIKKDIKSIVNIQRAFAKEPGLVAEGRDMGSIIFPDAIIKLFLTASTTTRAKRRHNQLKEKVINVSLSQLIDELAARDKRDTVRAVSPLIAPEDALIESRSSAVSIKTQEENCLVGVRTPAIIGVGNEILKEEVAS